MESVPEHDEFAFLDTPEMQALLAARAAELPSEPSAIEAYLEAMPLLATRESEQKSATMEALEALALETPTEECATEFKNSGNTAFKLAQRIKDDARKLEAKSAELERRHRTQRLSMGDAELKQWETERAERDEQLRKLRVSERKRLQDAIEYYTQGIHAILSEPQQQQPSQPSQPSSSSPPTTTPSLDTLTTDLSVANHTEMANVFRSLARAELSAELRSLAAALFANRAQIHLGLGNYGRCIRECACSVMCDPLNNKPWYRGASAMLKLNKLARAKEWCARGRQLKLTDAESASFGKLADEIEAATAAERERQVRRFLEQQQRKAEEERVRAAALDQLAQLRAALSERGLSMGKPLFRPDGSANTSASASAARNAGNADSNNADDDEYVEADYLASVMSSSSGAAASPYTSKPVVLDDGSMTFPVLFLYPEHAQTDFIQSVPETDSLSAHMQQMFPPLGAAPEWDTDGRYVWGALRVCIEIPGGRAHEARRKQRAQQRGTFDAHEDVVEVRVLDDRVQVVVDPELSLLNVLTLPALLNRGYRVPAGVPTFVVEAAPKAR